VWEAIESRKWDGGVFHPMCTYLTVSAAWAFKDPDFKRYPGVGYHLRPKPGTLTGAKRRIQREIELANFRRLLALPFPAAIENPGLSFINTAIRSPHQCVHPWMFGDDASKNTGFWLVNGMPRLQVDPDDAYPPRWVMGKKGALPRWSNQTDSGQNNLSPGDDRWLDRSATYPGIAHAMGTQWGKWLRSRV